MALFPECRPQCAQTVLDTADIVRDGDLSTVMVPVPSSETAGFSVSIHAGGAKWPRLTHVSCPTLHVSELVDCRFKIKRGLRGTSATVVVLYMMAGFSHVDF